MLGLLRPPRWPGLGVPCLAGAIPTEGTTLSPTSRSRLLPILTQFLLPATLWTRVWRGHVHPYLPTPCSPTNHACTPWGRTGRRGHQIFVLFYRDVSSRRAPCARERPPPGAGLPSPPTPATPWLPPPRPPHRPHPTGQVLSLLEIKLHSLWCCGAAAHVLCFVVGNSAGEGVAVTVTHRGPPACLLPPAPSLHPCPQDPAAQG